MMVPNFFTLLALCAGLTSIRMAIEGRYEFALIAIVFAALLDGIDGRIARLLKASSRFGAELDSLADFVNFGVAPAILIFIWGLGEHKSIGWIAVMLFAIASALRLARFNAALDEDRPHWQKNYFVGIPTSAAAMIVLLPVYIADLGLDLRQTTWGMNAIVVYTVMLGVLMVSTIPTYSGKLLGERIGREWVLPLFIVAMATVACLVTYPFETLTLVSLGYIASIPHSWRAYRRSIALHQNAPLESEETSPPATNPASESGIEAPGSPENVVEMRTSDQNRT